MTKSPTIDQTYADLASLATSRFPQNNATDAPVTVVQWRFMYQNNRSATATLLTLPFLLILGHGHLYHVERNFTTFHYWPEDAVNRFVLRSRLAHVERHFLLGISVIALVGAVVLGLPLIFLPFAPGKIDHMGPFIALCAAFVALVAALIGVFKLRMASYHWPLPAELQFLGVSRAFPTTINGRRV